MRYQSSLLSPLLYRAVRSGVSHPQKWQRLRCISLQAEDVSPPALRDGFAKIRSSSRLLLAEFAMDQGHSSAQSAYRKT
jgi:hypothetical protein